VTAVSAAGERVIDAADFFLGPLESALRPDELAVSAWFPALPPRSGTAFCEVARRHGDYALCGVAAIVTLDGDDEVAAVRCGYLSVGETPVVADLTAAWQSGSDDAVDAARRAVDPATDLHASADYRRHLVGVLTGRAVRQAIGAAHAGRDAA
jgi:carbon-monoxide dehydrogenase medium subunit